jgi:hypothetical protein
LGIGQQSKKERKMRAKYNNLHNKGMDTGSDHKKLNMWNLLENTII